ncbi:MAG: hypothetical protein LBQ20_08930 [Rhodanobacter sp.]|jgi:hypothetical protein|nr:hypothetical protein [Rhodanobacter sp.]
MSFFILYFEQNSSKNKIHQGQLNVYSIDRGITEGRTVIQYNGMSIEASILASLQDASLFYIFKKPTKMIELAQRARDKLFRFIKSRMDFKFDLYLYVFDLHKDWPEKITEKPIEISFSNLEDFFKENIQIGLFKIGP